MSKLYAVVKWHGLRNDNSGYGEPMSFKEATALANEKNATHRGYFSYTVELVSSKPETPSDDYDWQDDTDDRGWRTYGDRMAMQSRAEM